MSKDCRHDKWQYVRHTKSPSDHFFAAQCTDCQDLIKLGRHGCRLFLRASEIPADAVIHPMVEGGCND